MIPLTIEDVESINLNEWNFRPVKEIFEEWEKKKNEK